MTTKTATDYSQAWAALVECQQAIHAAHIQQSKAIASSHDGWHDARMRVVEAKAQLLTHERRAMMGACAPAPHATDLALYERARREHAKGEGVGAAMFRIATSAEPATQVEKPNQATVTHITSTIADGRLKDERIAELERVIGERDRQAGPKPWASMSEDERGRWISQEVYEAATRREADRAQAAQQAIASPSMPAWADLSADEQSRWISERVYEGVRHRTN